MFSKSCQKNNYFNQTSQILITLNQSYLDSFPVEQTFNNLQTNIYPFVTIVHHCHTALDFVSCFGTFETFIPNKL